MFKENFFIIFVDPGACNMFISHPLDTVKTNMQSGNMRFLPAAKVLLKTEGVSRRPLIYTMLIPCSTQNIVRSSIKGSSLLSWPIIPSVFNRIFKFGHIRCLWQFISNVSRYVSWNEH